jgi:hypothetical protein
VKRAADTVICDTFRNKEAGRGATRGDCNSGKNNYKARMNLERLQPDAQPKESDSPEESGKIRASKHVRFSIRKCRSILGARCSLTDSQILELRDALYDFANVALETNKDGVHPR